MQIVVLIVQIIQVICIVAFIITFLVQVVALLGLLSALIKNGFDRSFFHGIYILFCLCACQPLLIFSIIQDWYDYQDYYSTMVGMAFIQIGIALFYAFPGYLCNCWIIH